MYKRDERFFLNDISDSIQAIESFVEGMTREELEKDRKSFSATIRELEIIGEAVTNVSDEIKQKYPLVMWIITRRGYGGVTVGHQGADERKIN